MSRRLSKGGKNNRKSMNRNDSDFSQEQDFSLDLVSEQNLGKRTGKVYNQKNWKKNSDGFYDIDIQDDDSLTPQTKIAQLKQFLGLHRQEEQSNKNKNQVSEDEQSQYQQKGQVSRQNGNKNKRQSFAQRRKSRKTEFQFSFSLDMEEYQEEGLMQVSFSSQQTNLEKKFVQINKSSGKNKKNIEKQSLQKELQVQQKQKKQKIVKKRVSFREQQPKNNKQPQKEQKHIFKKEQIKPQTLRISRKPQNLTQQEVKPSKLRPSLTRESQKLNIQPQIQLNKVQTNFSKNKSEQKNFKDISEIQIHQKSLQISFDHDLFGSFLIEMENVPSNSQTVGELNRAIINTQTENTKEDQQKQIKQKDFSLNKKLKAIEKQQKQKRNLTTKSQPQFQPQNKKNPEQQNKNQGPTKKVKQNFFLTESMRKQALYYYEQQKKQAEQIKQLQLQKKKKKQGKRDREFQKIQTDDILNEEKLNEMKQKSQHQKALKKLKTNETVKASKKQQEQKLSKVQKAQKLKKNKEKEKEKVKDDQEKKQSKKYENKQKDQLHQILQEKPYIEQDNDYNPQEDEDKIKINNRLVKEADKLIKRKQKPERVSPMQKKGLKKSQTMSMGRKFESDQRGKVSRAKTEVQRLMGNRNDSIIDDSMMESGRKYPKRKRFAPIQSWNGEKIVYNRNGEATVESKQLVRLIGCVNCNDLDPEITLVKKDRYIQKIQLFPRQIVDFDGFDDKYRQLQITYLRKSKCSYEKLKKSVQVYQDGEITRLVQPCIIKANSGNFTIQNTTEECAYLEMVLFKNQDIEI